MEISSEMEEDCRTVGREAIGVTKCGINYSNWAFLGVDSRVI